MFSTPYYSNTLLQFWTPYSQKIFRLRRAWFSRESICNLNTPLESGDKNFLNPNGQSRNLNVYDQDTIFITDGYS